VARKRYVQRYATRRGVRLCVAAGVAVCLVVVVPVLLFANIGVIVLVMLDLMVLAVPYFLCVRWEARVAGRAESWGETRLRIDEEGIYLGETGEFCAWSRIRHVRLVPQGTEEPRPYDLVVTGRDSCQRTQHLVVRDKVRAAVTAFSPAGLLVP
jgi:hypothetical protein